MEKKAFPIDQFIPLGNSTVGSSIQFNNKEYEVESLENFSPKKGQFIIFSAGSSIAEQYAEALFMGSFVVDLSSNFRYEDDVPLIIPEINGEIVSRLSKPSLIANPNCSTAQLLLALKKPIHDQVKIKFLNIATYQAVSGTGKATVESCIIKHILLNQNLNLLLSQANCF